MPLGEHLADALGGQLLAGAEPVDDERQDQLRIEFEDPGDQGMVGQPADRFDDGRDQPFPAVAGRRQRRLIGRRDDRADLLGEQRPPQSGSVAVLAVDGHAADARPAGNIGQGGAPQPDGGDLFGGRRRIVVLRCDVTCHTVLRARGNRVQHRRRLAGTAGAIRRVARESPPPVRAFLDRALRRACSPHRRRRSRWRTSRSRHPRSARRRASASARSRPSARTPRLGLPTPAASPTATWCASAPVTRRERPMRSSAVTQPAQVEELLRLCTAGTDRRGPVRRGHQRRRRRRAAAGRLLGAHRARPGRP